MCFCDIPVGDLGLHMRKYSPFGLAFKKDFFAEQGALPVFYVPEAGRPAVTLKENLAVLFDQFAERIGHACYSELVRARLPLRLAEARMRIEELHRDIGILSIRMQPASPPSMRSRHPRSNSAQSLKGRSECLSSLTSSVRKRRRLG